MEEEPTILMTIDNGTEKSFIGIAETYPDNYTLVQITVVQNGSIPEIGTPICLGDNQEELLVLARENNIREVTLVIDGENLTYKI